MEKLEDWNITANRFVVFIDIMGFKDLVARSTHDEIYTQMKRIDEKIKHVQEVDWLKDFKKNLVHSTTYSDSIILYSKDETFEAFDFLVSTTAGLINYLFLEGVPFKGAMAFGTMTLDTQKSIFFGQPLIDAYLLQEEINFYGILFHSSVDKNLEVNKKEWPPFTSLYLCDLKAGSAKHMTIYPMHARQKDDEEYGEQYLELLNAVNKLRYNTSGHLRKYIDNTEKYLLEVSNNFKRKYN